MFGVPNEREPDSASRRCVGADTWPWETLTALNSARFSQTRQVASSLLAVVFLFLQRSMTGVYSWCSYNTTPHMSLNQHPICFSAPALLDGPTGPYIYRGMLLAHQTVSPLISYFCRVHSMVAHRAQGPDSGGGSTRKMHQVNHFSFSRPKLIL